MKRTSFLLFILAAAVLVASIGAAPARATDDNLSYARIVRLSYVTGDVQIMRPGDASKWETAFANMPIQQGFTIGSNNGIAEIEFEQGSAVWLSRNTVLQFTELALSDGGRITKMTVAQGTASFQAGVHTGDTFAISTPQFEIATLGKSGFRIDAFTGGGSVNVFAGSLSITSSAGTQTVTRGETLTFDSNAPVKAGVSSNPSRDSWDRWVSSRENYLVNGATQTQQNASSPYSYGAADLSSYGSWNYIAGCGYGWQPYGVRAGWMPFLDGQWMAYPGIGWTWVSFEQWGWMPYHFGGWSNCGGAGWMWMPGENSFWSAGPVQWVGNGGRLGWRPLPPRNPRVNAPHPAASPVVFATKNLTKEGRYEIMPGAKAANSFHEFSSAPLADGKMPTPGISTTDRSAASGGGQVVVSTASNLTMLRAMTAGTSSPVGHASNGAGSSNLMLSTPGAIATPAAIPRAGLVNAALPPMRVPSPPPVRAYAFAPSQPGQASARPSSESGRGWTGGSASAGARSESGGGSRGSAGTSASSSASSGARSGGGGASNSGGSASTGGGGRPH